MSSSRRLYRPPLLKQLLLQLTITFVLGLLFGWHQGCFWACFKTIAIGGSIAAFSAFYSNWRAFKFTFEKGSSVGEVAAHTILSDLHRATVSKVILSAVMLVIVIKYGDEDMKIATLIVAYVLISLVATASNTYYLKNIKQ